ncbi:hypothetical protein ACPV4H_08825 [Vibrio rotiferianus]|uniref:hypothetical protein n=1 Tax=Vibrio rotiferianus TaxID=190895 RepID=UPI00406A2269
MQKITLLLSLAASGYAFAEATTLDFESAVEEFTEVTIETTSVDFTDPTAAFSSIQLGYNSSGFDLGLGYARSLTDDWAGLVFAQSLESFDTYRVRAAALSTSYGTGVMGDYIYDSDSGTHSMVMNALQVLPLHERLLIAPVIGVGMISNENLDSDIAIAMAQLYSVVKVTKDLSVMVTPIYTRSLSDKTMKINTLDWETNLSYRLSHNQNISANFGMYEKADNTVGARYTYAF